MPNYILDGKLDIEPLISTRDFLKKALKEAKTDLEIAGAVKSFEVCLELSWKICKKILNLRGTEVFTPKEVFRIAGIEGLIDNAESWFEYIDKRNRTVHDYTDDILETIYPILPQFLKNLNTLIRNLQKL